MPRGFAMAKAAVIRVPFSYQAHPGWRRSLAPSAARRRRAHRGGSKVSFPSLLEPAALPGGCPGAVGSVPLDAVVVKPLRSTDGDGVDIEDA
jgi:hypothetical protein